MSYDLNFSRIIQAPRPEVFNYFTDATLLESWCYPDGMSLKVPFFENNLHGQYIRIFLENSMYVQVT